MALEDDRCGTVHEMRGPLACLADCAALAGVDIDALVTMAEGAVHFSLPAGYVLFDAGAAPDGIYLVASGRLGVKDAGGPAWTAYVGAGEFVGELGWLLAERRSARIVALRDSELLWLTPALLDAVAARHAGFSLAIARLCARRLRLSARHSGPRPRAHVLTIVPNSAATDSASFATLLVAELARSGRAELVWDVRASSHTAHWFNRVEENNDYVVYLADPLPSGWTRQCCRQADLLLLAADSSETPAPWPGVVAETAARPGVRVELALLHGGPLQAGAAARWLAATPASQHHHVTCAGDVGRIARLLSRQGVGLVLSGGGARGFAHLGVIRALREARVPLDYVGGSSIGSVIAAGLACGWSDAEMRHRYHRTFVATNPLNDYTFPFVALTRGRKVSRLLRDEFGETAIEDLPLPFFCVSANLTSGRAFEHRSGALWHALRASVAIPGVVPPVFRDGDILVDGAAVNSLPVDLMQNYAPGCVIGSDAGAVSSFGADSTARGQPPIWKLFSKGRRGKPRINIFQILTESSMVGGASSAAAQREFADVILKPPLEDIELLDWQSFDRAIDVGYRYARVALEGLPALPRLAAAPARTTAAARALAAEIDRRRQAKSAVP